MKYTVYVIQELVGHEEYKTIGVFSSEAKANEIVAKRREEEDYDRNGFYLWIEEHTLNELGEWQ